MDNITPNQEQLPPLPQPPTLSVPSASPPSPDPDEQKPWMLPKREIGIIAFVIVLIFSIIGYNAVTGPKQPPFPSPTPIAAAISPSSMPTALPTDDVSAIPRFTPPLEWVMFTDPRYNVTFYHSPTFAPDTRNQPYYFLPTSVIILTSSSSAYTAPTYTQESFFSVSTDTKSESCYKDPSNGPALTQMLTSPVGTYYVAEAFDASAGNIYHSKIYRLLHSNQCYELVLMVHSATDGNGIDFAASELSQTAAMRQLEQMVSTFSFTEAFTLLPDAPGKVIGNYLHVQLTYPLLVNGEKVTFQPDSAGNFALTGSNDMRIAIYANPSNGKSPRTQVDEIIDQMTAPPMASCCMSSDTSALDTKFRQEQMKRISREPFTVDGIVGEKVAGIGTYAVYILKNDRFYSFELSPYIPEKDSIQRDAWVKAFLDMLATCKFV